MSTELRTQSRVALHGCIVLWLGLLAGIGFSYSAYLELPSHGSWRFAHLEGLLNGIMVIAVAGIWPRFDETARAISVARWTLILGAYCNVIGPLITALFIGHRVIEPQTALETLVVYAFYAPGTLPLVSLPIFALDLWRQGTR